MSIVELLVEIDTLRAERDQLTLRLAQAEGDAAELRAQLSWRAET